MYSGWCFRRSVKTFRDLGKTDRRDCCDRLSEEFSGDRAPWRVTLCSRYRCMFCSMYSCDVGLLLGVFFVLRCIFSVCCTCVQQRVLSKGFRAPCFLLGQVVFALSDASAASFALRAFTANFTRTNVGISLLFCVFLPYGKTEYIYIQMVRNTKGFHKERW